MSTRGALGFHLDGKDHLTYNHSDSYPSGLGVETLEFCRKHANTEEKIAKLRKQVAALKPCEGTPTPADIKALAPWTDLGVSTQSTQDWYCLTRMAQGNLVETLKSGYLAYANDFITESLFCEWGYILNLDTRHLEVYKGFQTKPHRRGRYRDFKPDPKDTNSTPYYACALVRRYPLCLPTDEQLCKLRG